MIATVPLTIDPLQDGELPILHNLWSLYVHDMSSFVDQELGADGRFPTRDFEAWLAEPDRHAFLFRVSGRLAGFALVRRGGRIVTGPDVWEIAEFFVVRRHRRSGVGTAAAHALFERFRGTWEVRELRDNKKAIAFWRRAIVAFTAGAMRESVIDDQRWRGVVQWFESREPAPAPLASDVLPSRYHPGAYDLRCLHPLQPGGLRCVDPFSLSRSPSRSSSPARRQEEPTPKPRRPVRRGRRPETPDLPARAARAPRPRRGLRARGVARSRRRARGAVAAQAAARAEAPSRKESGSPRPWSSSSITRGACARTRPRPRSSARARPPTASGRCFARPSTRSSTSCPTIPARGSSTIPTT